jgi:hypothetical protein
MRAILSVKGDRSSVTTVPAMPMFPVAHEIGWAQWNADLAEKLYGSVL